MNFRIDNVNRFLYVNKCVYKLKSKKISLCNNV